MIGSVSFWASYNSAHDVKEAAMKKGSIAVTRESADLIYHLCVLWLDQGISPTDVFNELKRREGTSGLVEKESRREND